MKTLKEFVRSRVSMTKTQFNEIYGDIVENYDKIFVYADGLHIEVDGEEDYSLVVERSYYTDKDLSVLENILWDDFAKWELGVSTEEAEVDLHQRAKNLLDNMGCNCSLDEVDLESVSEKHKNQAKYLLKQFDELDTEIRDRKFDREQRRNTKFKEVFESLVTRRFKNAEEIDNFILERLEFNPNLEKKVFDSETHNDFNLKLDNELISNCTVNGEDLCYLDVYYLIDNSKQLYITEVGYDFAT